MSFRVVWKCLLVCALLVSSGCPVDPNHPIIGSWRLFLDGYSDGELVSTDTVVVRFDAFGRWTMPSFDGSISYSGIWRETSDSSVVADISDQRYFDGVLVLQDITYNLSVTGDGLTGDGLIRVCLDLDCKNGEQIIEGVWLSKSN